MASSKAFLSAFLLLFLTTLLGCEKKPSYQTTGYAEANLFYIAASYGGTIKELSVHAGQTLKKEQNILKIEDHNFLTAPAKSRVVDIFYQEKEFVPPTYPIVSLFIPSQMKIIFFVSEKNLNKIKLNKKVTILFNNKKYPVKITDIASQAEFTPDFIFSEHNRYKFIYKIKTEVSPELQNLLKIGQPVDVNYE